MVDTLINGLKRLEYRGYDSAGLASVTTEGQIYLQKTVGRVAALEEASANHPINLYHAGIAHTRWATHGIPSEANAHPHLSFDGQICLVHNGIIENYQTLKHELQADGVVFKSETDTEIISNLIAKYYSPEIDLKQAILQALARLQGAYAVVVISNREPNRLIGAKQGSPLVCGIGLDEFILASDVSAIISKTKDVIYLEDGELIDISNNDYTISTFTNQTLQKKIEHVEWDQEAASKGGYDHFLLKEIMEQPQAIRDTLRGRLIFEEGNIKLGGLIDVMDRLALMKRVILLGIGTSYYACKLGEMYFESIAKIPAKAEMTPEFRYNSNVIDSETLVIAVSQSGETADTIAAIQEAKRKGALVLGVVNTVGSTISRITDAGVYNHIGPEIAVASTKAFTSQSLVLLMYAILMGRQRQLSLSEGQSLIKAMQELPEQVQQILDINPNITNLADKYKDYHNLIYIGRKFSYPIALEGALKIKEISYIHAEGLSGGELKHGFIALIDENTPTVALVPQDSIYDKMFSAVEQVKARSGKILAITTEGEQNLSAVAEDVIRIPSTAEEVQPLLNAVVLQLLAYHTSRLKGLDVDKPRNLAKSVTVE
ncbi:MAG: glutamine--fructose-6-phosphate transaminase (isomerizing) [Patescibacteria group bacterium]